MNARISVIGSRDLPAGGDRVLSKVDPKATSGRAVKNNCNLGLNRAGFRHAAMPFAARVGGSLVVLAPREFSSGSLGWCCEDVIQVGVGRETVRCLVDIDLVISGSKKRLMVADTAKPAEQLTRSHFLEQGEPLSCYFRGRSLRLDVREFSTGLLGWFAQDPINIEVDGQIVDCTIETKVWINGSKSLPQ